jgi:protocatechuate 3,4-dioxygenase beta subunit
MTSELAGSAPVKLPPMGPAAGPIADGRLDPPYHYPDYRSTRLRAPKRELFPMPEGLTERRGPLFGESQVDPGDSSGRVTDTEGRPIRRQLVEIWQANAAGRYRHAVDQHRAPLDPNFTGGGRCLTDDDGHYRFVTIKPGAYPWENHHNAWRPAHIHFSVFGTCFAERLVTQMYFPGDPLLAFDPVYQSIRDSRSAELLIARFDLATTAEGWALGYVFDIVLAGPHATPVEERAGE